ncbi:MAG: translation elongation factor Ts [Planctomycetales bacterium]|nr:translation elongation factor Ts [Planctomycetales bacterium]
MPEIPAKDVMALRERTGCPMMDCKAALVEAKGDLAGAEEILRKKGLASAAGRQARAATEGAIAGLVSPDASRGVLVEVNCQTDFVARNKDFVAVASEAAATAGEGAAPRDAADLLGRRVPGASQTLADRIAARGSALREKIEVRRLVRYDVPAGKRGWVGLYLHHNSRMGSLVLLLWDGADRPAEPPEGILRDLTFQVASNPPLAVRREDVPKEAVAKEREIQAGTEDLKQKPEAVRGKIVEGRMQKWFAEMCLLEQPFVKDAKQSIATLLARVGKGKLTVAAATRFEVGK